MGLPFQAFYSAGKFATDGFSEALRMEVRKFNIKVVLVNPGDSSALANALVDLLTDESKRKRLGNRLFKHVSNHFSQKNVLLRLCSIYSELMSK